jgi:orotidine-5'-phosphate decarboxylase
MLAIPPRDRLIVALDVPTVQEAEAMTRRLGDSVTFYKVGLQLASTPDGIGFAAALAASGKHVFLDMKLLDIENTVAGAVKSIAALGVTFVTIHAYPGAMRAAVEARGNAKLKLLGVTVLTSMDDADVAEAGYTATASELVTLRAAQAKEIGMDGVVASPAEAAAVRAVVGPDMAVVTPGIRTLGSATGDQKRIATPTLAVRSGADYLVVGRSITADANPRAAADAVVEEIAAASKEPVGA